VKRRIKRVSGIKPLTKLVSQQVKRYKRRRKTQYLMSTKSTTPNTARRQLLRQIAETKRQSINRREAWLSKRITRPPLFFNCSRVRIAQKQKFVLAQTRCSFRRVPSPGYCLLKPVVSNQVLSHLMYHERPKKVAAKFRFELLQPVCDADDSW